MLPGIRCDLESTYFVFAEPGACFKKHGTSENRTRAWSLSSFRTIGWSWPGPERGTHWQCARFGRRWLSGRARAMAWAGGGLEAFLAPLYIYIYMCVC